MRIEVKQTTNGAYKRLRISGEGQQGEVLTIETDLLNEDEGVSLAHQLEVIAFELRFGW